MDSGRQRPDRLVQAAMTFTEEWFHQPSQDALAQLGREAPEGMIVEIGSWEGRSTCALANAVEPRTVHAVDTWAGSPGEISHDLATQRDVYAQWAANVKELTAGNVQPHRMGWRDYLPTVTEQIGLAFIDAEHTYREVHDNITAILPLLAPGGILCGDDQHHPPIRQALTELFNPADVEIVASLWIWRNPSNDLETEYRKRCRTPSDIYAHLPRMVDLVEALDAKHVIELGSRTGVSTIAWLYGLAKTGGRLTSVDLDQAPEIGSWSDWTHIQGDDLNPEIVSSLEPADVVFIDTSHTLNQTRQELNTYRWLVKPGGVLCGHDSELGHPEDSPPSDPVFPVKRAVEEFVRENGFEWLNYPDCNGFYVIKIP